MHKIHCHVVSFNSNLQYDSQSRSFERMMVEREMNLKGTKTEKNLLTSFAGESQARNRYTMASKTAKKEG